MVLMSIADGRRSTTIHGREGEDEGISDSASRQLA
jgi:hypothetical protein